MKIHCTFFGKKAERIDFFFILWYDIEVKQGISITDLVYGIP